MQPPARRSSVQAIERARNFIEWNFPMGVLEYFGVLLAAFAATFLGPRFPDSWLLAIPSCRKTLEAAVELTSRNGFR